MMADEPALGLEFDVGAAPQLPEESVAGHIQALLRGQAFAVLCTQGDGQPYGSVVAFAFSSGLASFVFATPTATRKYRLLSGCDRVALVVDNRGEHPDDLMKVGAVTVTGRAHLVDAGPEFDRWAELLVTRHPYLTSFVRAPSTALFRVDVVRFLHVTRFQEVHQWIPSPAG
jgi:nitroimidazol reductase NimA-like FMN-containing flavoprotein (pyridoxamine 5'-phosphate oxidase superfamily)